MYISYTESVDTSAELLAQALDVQSHLGPPPPDADRVLFYGAVKLDVDFNLSADNVFNDPRKSRPLLNKLKALEIASQLGVKTLKYYRTDKNSFSSLKEKTGTKTLSLISRQAGMQEVGIASTEVEYKDRIAAGHIQYVRASNIDVNGKFRVFVGNPEHVQNIVLGVLKTEKRQLTFKETLLLDKGQEARAAFEQAFKDGILKENMGDGIMAWSEETFEDSSSIPKGVVSSIKKLQKHFKVDFMALDFVRTEGNNNYFLSNITAYPSLQQVDILSVVSDYFSKITEDKPVTRDQLAEAIKNLPDEQFNLLAEIFKYGKRKDPETNVSAGPA